MNPLGLARLQFGVTTVYHFLFVPLTIGLAFLLALMETIYVKTGDEDYKKMVDFFGRLFLINFSVGVVTGILLEFQFGMNWANYSRFVGDVFGAPLAVEALLAFFLESTFLGIWIFGWDRISPRLHAATMWLVAVGTTISAFWILVANSFMQEPVGYAVQRGHAVMVNFFALLGNPQLWVEFPHTEFAALATGSFFVVGVSAYHLLRRQHVQIFQRAFRLGIMVAALTSVLVVVVGHDQAQHIVRAQPMKMAASEALWHTSPMHAPWTVLAMIHPAMKKNTDSIQIPDLLSILAYNQTTGRVMGMNRIQQEYRHRYGPGNYIPPVIPTFWSFRIMVLAGTLMVLIAIRGALLTMHNRFVNRTGFLRLTVFSIGLPFIANIMGWIMTEVGRQPWVVFGLEKTAIGVSPDVSAAEIWATLIGFGGLYGIIAVADIYLLVKYIKLGPEAHEPDILTTTSDPI